MEIFEPDPLDEEMLIESLGGTSPTPHPPAPTPAILALLAKRAMQQAAAKQQTAQTPTTLPPLPPQSSREVLGQVQAPDFRSTNQRDERGQPVVLPEPTRMRAATPEERVVGRLEEAGDINADLVRAQFARTPNQPETARPSMRAATTGERIGDQFGDLLNKLKPAWMNAEQVRQTTLPEPHHVRIDPTMGSAAPGEGGTAEAVSSVLAKVLKSKKAPKAPPFAFAPVDEAAKARMAAMASGEGFSMKSLPPNARPTSVHRTIQQQGGISVSPVTGQMIEIGKPGPTMVGIFPNSSGRTMPIPAADFKPAHVRQFLETNQDVFANDPEAFMGGWLDKETNTVYLDVSKGFETTRAATKFGELQNPGNVLRGGKPGKPTGVERDPVTGKWPQAQKNVFEPETMTEPPIGNLHEFLGSPEFQDRVHEMAAIGREAMGGNNPEWWDIVNGPMARVYGKENVEALAGYIASTSPQNGPVANMKMASELMRRHLKDEPVRQPDWRAPATAMGKVDEQGNQMLIQSGQNKGDVAGEGFAPKAGAAFPNEGTYAPNAERVRAGTPEKVTDDKVNDMFHALMGKLTGVFDRHWAKIAEKPEAGIFADKVQNRLAGSMTSGQVEAYPLVENAVRTAAKQAGVDISKYSAWVWEGIRDTIRKTGKLYGQEHRASAIPETTTGFNEIFEQLVDAKAKHLGISVKELENKLRSGDAELLGLILATPVGAAAYAKWNAAQRPTSKDGGA